jgi:hypothetical protein
MHKINSLWSQIHDSITCMCSQGSGSEKRKDTTFSSQGSALDFREETGQNNILSSKVIKESENNT